MRVGNPSILNLCLRGWMKCKDLIFCVVDYCELNAKNKNNCWCLCFKLGGE